MGFRVLVLGDGEFDVGKSNANYAAGDKLPALACLVHRLLKEPPCARYTCDTLKKHVRTVRTKGFESKAKTAIAQASLEKYDAVVIAIDRDGDKDRLPKLSAGRDEVQSDEYAPCAIGQAIESFDAWMIVDGKAIGAAGGDASRSHPDPEKLCGKNDNRDPKVWAMGILGGKEGLGGKYAEIARKADLSLLEECCRDGFKPFSDEVRSRILPAVPAS